MASNNSFNSEQNWAPDTHDIYGGPSKVVDALARKADARESFSSIELGIDAGRAVLDQYYFAKGENNMGTALRTIFSLQNVTNLSAAVLPVAGAVAAIGVDYEIFGSAAEDLIQTNLPFNAFAFGSLIFASALGLSEKYENTTKKMFLYGALILASVGASFIAANNDNFRAHFTDTIKSAFTTGSDDERTNLQRLNSAIASAEKNITDNRNTIEANNQRRAVLETDGKTDNDYIADEIGTQNTQLQGQIDALVKQKSDDEKKLSLAGPALEQATRKDWADFVGRMAATSYIAAWLIAAQLLLSEIIRKASSNFEGFRNALVTRSRQKKFVKDIENEDPDKRNAVIQSAVQAMLSRFSEVLSLSKQDPKHPNKHTNFAKLYEGEAYPHMLKTGVDMVKDATFPRGPSLWDRIKELKTSFNRRSEGAPVDETPDGEQQSAEPHADQGPRPQA